MKISILKLRILRIKGHIVCTDDFITGNYELPWHMRPRLSWELKNADINIFFYYLKKEISVLDFFKFILF